MNIITQEAKKRQAVVKLSVKKGKSVNSQSKCNLKLHCCIYFENLHTESLLKYLQKTLDMKDFM